MKVKKMLAVFMSVLSLAACILPFSGCGKTVGKVHNKGVKSGAVRDLTEGISKNESASKAPDDEFKAAASSFAAELFKDNYSKGKTTLVSPLSVLTALALVQNGAQGNTLAQLEQALGGLDRDALNAYMQKAKYIPFGEQPMLGYVSAKDNEFTAIRIILTGRLADLPADVIRERLRNAYV